MIEEMKLKNHFQYFLKNKPSSSRKKCPPPPKLIKLLRLELPEKKRHKLIDHIADCYPCAQEFQAINEILKAEDSFDRKMSKVFSMRYAGPERKRDVFKGSIWRPSWSLRAALIVVFFLIVSSPLFFILKTKRTAEERRALPHVNRLVPDEKSLGLNDLIFRWEPVADSAFYTVEIFDDSLRHIWESERVLVNSLAPPHDLKERLDQGGTYLWMVTAHLENGSRMESLLAKFILKK